MFNPRHEPGRQVASAGRVPGITLTHKEKPMPTMRPPMPHCEPRLTFRIAMLNRHGIRRAAWFFGPPHAKASIVAGDGVKGNGINTWEVLYPGDSEPMGHQSAWQIAARMAGYYVSPYFKPAPTQP